MSGAAHTVEARNGSSTLPMHQWKRLVADLVASDPDARLRVVHFGGANQILGYRLYYMLQFAKAAGVRHLSLITDGAFWIDEATDWLIDSRVDEIELIAPGAELTSDLARRVADLRRRGAGAPAIAVRSTGGGKIEQWSRTGKQFDQP